MTSLQRFLDAQDGTFEQALAELKAGAKRSHWIWFVFPQIAGLGHSQTARYFAIADIDEAKAYLAHETLGQRVRECTRAMLDWRGRKTARDILGTIDALKFASSMTLFESAGDDALFGQALDAFHDGERDALTLRKLN